MSHLKGQAVSHALPSQPVSLTQDPAAARPLQQRSLQPLAAWGILPVTMENALVESKTAQPKLIPMSWCPLRAADDLRGLKLFGSCGLHHHVAAHNPSQIHTELMFSFLVFFLMKMTKGAVSTFLFYCTTTFLYYFTAPLLQTRITTVHQSSSLHSSAEMMVHRVISNISHML